MSKHTPEPWYHRHQRNEIVGDGALVVCNILRHTNGDRIVSCVNALAGRDPEKLAELEKAVEAVIHSDRDVDHRIDGLASALAAFRKETT